MTGTDPRAWAHDAYASERAFAVRSGVALTFGGVAVGLIGLAVFPPIALLALWPELAGLALALALNVRFQWRMDWEAIAAEDRVLLGLRFGLAWGASTGASYAACWLALRGAVLAWLLWGAGTSDALWPLAVIVSVALATVLLGTIGGLAVGTVVPLLRPLRGP